MSRFLIDANCSIFAMNGASPNLRQRLEATAPGDIALSAISLAEIELGRRLGKGAPEDVLAAFLHVIPTLSFDAAAARAYARLPFKRARFDRLLAAHALSLDAVIVTNNERDFDDLPGLRIENWTR